MHAIVEKAVDTLRKAFPGTKVEYTEDGKGGANVRVEPIMLSSTYVQESTWVGANIPAQIPYADIYPLFVRADLARRDGKPLGEGLSTGHTFMERPAVQASRRSNGRDPTVETPALKFVKVVDWLNSK